jgi:hypothetical protein
MSVAAGVVGDLLVSTAITDALVTAQSRGATASQIAEHASFFPREPIESTTAGGVVSDDISDLGPLRTHAAGTSAQACRSKSVAFPDLPRGGPVATCK